MAGTKAVHGLLWCYVTQKKSPYILHVPSSTEAGELAVLKTLNAEFMKICKPITVKLGKYTFKNVVGINKIAGVPKADVALVAWKDKKLQNVAFISHKMGATARDFQQYSGATPVADGKKQGSISKHPAVIKFLEAVSQPGPYERITQGKERFYHKIVSGPLIGRAVYGPFYVKGSTNFGEDNIHVIGQGTPRLTKTGASYNLSFSGGIHSNGDTNPFLTGDYKAVIGARYTSGRTFTARGQICRNVRIMILPLVVLGGKSQLLTED